MDATASGECKIKVNPPGPPPTMAIFLLPMVFILGWFTYSLYHGFATFHQNLFRDDLLRSLEMLEIFIYQIEQRSEQQGPLRFKRQFPDHSGRRMPG